jgi:hypothetical protein
MVGSHRCRNTCSAAPFNAKVFFEQQQRWGGGDGGGM